MLNKSPGRLRLWAVAFWLILWQALSMLVNQEILLASPVSVIRCLLGLIATPAFWQSLLFSLLRIVGGFLAGAGLGVILATLSSRFQRIRELLMPFLMLIRAIPVASFVIVALIWVPSKNLSLLISALIVWPVIYAQVLNAIDHEDPKLNEMAQVFAIPPLRQIARIHLPQILPHFQVAAATAMGLAWKSGIAAEVIGIPGGSIGERLYRAKIYLMTPELFAWTLALIGLSVLCEKALVLALNGLSAILKKP